MAIPTAFLVFWRTSLQTEPRDSFNPDGGISFDKKPYNTHTAHPMQHEPSGTNLFDAEQATAMVRYMIEGLPHQ